MPDDLIRRLRKARERAVLLSSTLASDLKPFMHQDGLTFLRRPDRENVIGDVNVTTTCSALMCLASTHQHESLSGVAAHRRALRAIYEKDEYKKVQEAFAAVMSAQRWASSDLPDPNSFTVVLLLRAAGVLSKAGLIQRDWLLGLTHSFGPESQPENRERMGLDPAAGTVDITAIASGIGKDGPKSFSVLKYEPAPAIGYWFVDALDSLARDDIEPAWKAIAEWAIDQFARQVSYVVSNHDALKDPVAMGMSACLAARIKQMATRAKASPGREIAALLPSNVELDHAVKTLFEYQEPSGIWPKYFPLFHYPDAGSNYCFSFELLEALVREFATSDVLFEDPVLSGIERSIDWCENYRLEYRHEKKGKVFRGWNSGGQLATLTEGMPESWATAVVHMFLLELVAVLSDRIDGLVLETYGAHRVEGSTLLGDANSWDDLMDIPIFLGKGQPDTVKKLFEVEIIDKILTGSGTDSHHAQLRCRRSALLFGPPGTSKTTLARALAARLRWPFIEVNPSHFLNLGLEQIYTRANAIFDEIQELSHVVVLFDEMDGLVHSRGKGGAEGGALDAPREFLTTSMLPKLANLHDAGRILFFMATNHQGALDDAIKRPGRFDLLVCMGPPLWEAKRAALDVKWFGNPEASDDVVKVRDLLAPWTKDPNIIEQLDSFTVSEIKGLFEHLYRRALSEAGAPLTVIEALNRIGHAGFTLEVREWHKKRITLRKGTPARKEYDKDRKQSKVQ